MRNAGNDVPPSIFDQIFGRMESKAQRFQFMVAGGRVYRVEVATGKAWIAQPTGDWKLIQEPKS